MDSRQLIKTFQEMTGCNDEESRFHLEAHGWDVEEAISTYFSDKTGNKEIGMTSPPSLFPRRPPQPQAAQPTKKAEPKRSTGIRGFSDLNKGEDNDGSSDEENMKWFTGGEKSGLQVQAPKKANPNEILQNAQKMGAKNIVDQRDEDNKPFQGYGFRLGSQQSSGPSAPAPNTQAREHRYKIMFWKNGFSIDDGPLRSYEDPANRSFLNAINQGRVPPELQPTGNGPDVDVEMIDKQGEEYKAPPKVVKPFSGSGQKLGATSSAAPATPVASSTTGTTTGTKVEVDESQPTTTLQIRLTDGSRLIAKFNHTHTIKDIRSHIDSQKASPRYQLMTSFPQTVLSNEDQTLKDAGLLNAVIIQKAI